MDMTILIVLLLLVVLVVGDINLNQNKNEILISVKSDECFVIISRDGHQNKCQGHDNTYSISTSSIKRYDKVGLVIYHNTTGLFSDAKVIDVKELSYDLAEVEKKVPSKVTIVWPSLTTITTSTVDIHYYFNNDATNKICSRVSNLTKNNMNSDVSITRVTNDDDVKCYNPANIITISNLVNSEYCVHLYNYQFADVGDDIVREYMSKNSPDASTCFIVKISSLVPPTSMLSVWKEIPQPIVLSNQVCNPQDEKNMIHIVVMSARSVDRYEEAEVHLKSIIFNRSLTPKNKRAPVTIHMIVDDGGQNYFRDIYVKDNLNKFDDVHIVFHDFNYVCVKPLEKFLGSLDMKESFHHSGKAGYCRLFIPQYFQKLNETMANSDISSDIKYMSSLMPTDSLIALETDQVMLVAIDALYDQFQTFDDDDIIAAAENYQPWEDSRPLQSHNDFVASQDNVNHDGLYHGYGIIGGVMLFNLTRIANMTFIDDIISNVTTYAEFKDKNWQPRLNDQDIFNVFFKFSSNLLRILPCEWNVQFHARLNTIIQCLDFPNEDESYRFGSIPKTCANSVNSNIFACEKQPKVLHFMAQSYRDYNFLEFYSNFWSDYKSLSWSDIF